GDCLIADFSQSMRPFLCTGNLRFGQGRTTLEAKLANAPAEFATLDAISVEQRSVQHSGMIAATLAKAASHSAHSLKLHKPVSIDARPSSPPRYGLIQRLGRGRAQRFGQTGLIPSKSASSLNL